MSFLERGPGGSIPTAQTFPPPSPPNAQNAPGAATTADDALPAVGMPPFNLPAHLKSLATMLEREARRLDLIRNRRGEIGVQATGLRWQSLGLADMLRSLANDFAASPYPIANKPRTAGVSHG